MGTRHGLGSWHQAWPPSPGQGVSCGCSSASVGLLGQSRAGALFSHATGAAHRPLQHRLCLPRASPLGSRSACAGATGPSASLGRPWPWTMPHHSPVTAAQHRERVPVLLQDAGDCGCRWGQRHWLLHVTGCHLFAAVTLSAFPCVTRQGTRAGARLCDRASFWAGVLALRGLRLRCRELLHGQSCRRWPRPPGLCRAPCCGAVAGGEPRAVGLGQGGVGRAERAPGRPQGQLPPCAAR